LNGGDLANRDTDHLLEQTQKMEEVYRELKNAPITVNLAEGPMGVVGKLSVSKMKFISLSAISHFSTAIMICALSLFLTKPSIKNGNG
jgi:hypothetical protein